MREIKLNATQIYRKTPKGVLTNMYHKMKSRRYVGFSLTYFHDTFLNDSKFLRLHKEWINSGYEKSKKPSIDRISNKKDYIIGNIQIMTWGENRFKQIMERRSRKGVVIQCLQGKEVARFASQRAAVKKTGISQGNMSSCLNGKRTHCEGFAFSYESPELLDKD